MYTQVYRFIYNLLHKLDKGGQKNMARKSKFEPDVKQKAVDRVKSGESYSKVAKDVGTKPSVVKTWCVKNGVQSNHKFGRK